MAVKKGQEVARQRASNSLLVKFGEKFSLDPQKFLEVVSKTVFKEAKSQEQVIALLMVADQYGLSPITKEIYAFPDKGGGVVPVVGVDGWNRIAQQHPQFNGVEFRYADTDIVPDGGKRSPVWVECVVYRKDRDHPVVVREYLDECYRKTGPWQSHTKRMLRHKALIQGYRTAFGFHGIYDEDEAERMYVEGTPQQTVEVPSSNAEKARKVLSKASTPEAPPKAAEEPVEEEAEEAEAVEEPTFLHEEEWRAAEDAAETIEVDENGEVIDVIAKAKDILDAVEEPEPVEEKVIPPATKKQLEALVAAAKKGGWSNQLVTRMLKEQYGVAKAADLNREQALDMVKHLMAGNADEQEGLDL